MDIGSGQKVRLTDSQHWDDDDVGRKVMEICGRGEEGHVGWREDEVFDIRGFAKLKKFQKNQTG